MAMLKLLGLIDIAYTGMWQILESLGATRHRSSIYRDNGDTTMADIDNLSTGAWAHGRCGFGSLESTFLR